MIAAPRNMVIQGAWVMNCRPSLRMFPQLATYGGTPTPRKLRAASPSTAYANTKVAWTMIGERQLGRMLRRRMRTSLAPSARAASTCRLSRTTRTPLRTTRATRGM